MKKFDVTVRTLRGCIAYTAIAKSAIEAMLDAYDQFGVCGVSVEVAQ
ncbi:MAG TPA: hypothetical protein VGU61_19760 [Noviherbaspirillum sp.]|jgi:hypothetical protein|nr:hypothetical protein [Noviherbaspirillum sp.]HEV2612508.1 hypothetical protein [Noviherbaspirillum sp.]